MPFAQMGGHDLDFFLSHAVQHYYAPGEKLLEPASGPVHDLLYIRQGSVTGKRGLADLSGGAFQFEAGDLFPISAAVAQRAVTASYEAVGDTFVLALPVQAMQELARRSAPFADFLNRRVLTFLELSRKAVQAAYSSQTLAEQSLETQLGALVRRQAVTCQPHTLLREALSTMHEQHIGSMLVTGVHGEVLGILSRGDVLGRITLRGVDLQTPIEQVMVSPVHTLTHEHTAEDAALLMSRHGIRHVPITKDGQAVGIVSERDLFAIQRLSLKQLSSKLRAAPDVQVLQDGAEDIRRFARNLLSQGVQARQLTALISHLNDVLTERLLTLKAQKHGFDLNRICWLALGSEGRGEQTIATDQDNAMILADDCSRSEREMALLFAQEVNQALDTCGYPLCKGGVMAGNPNCCLTLSEWRQRFSHWIEFGAPQDLLNASIYFDFRLLAGNPRLEQELRNAVTGLAQSTPRFLKQMALNALTRGVPLNWLGGIASDEHGEIDLKLQGAAVFVDTARLYALAHGVGATSTRARFEAVGPLMGQLPAAYESWISGFEFLQMMRLQIQLQADVAPEKANRIALDRLNDIDRRILKETFRVARSLQQGLELDYQR